MKEDFLKEIHFSTTFFRYLLLSTVVFEIINDFDSISKNVYSIGRNCLPEAKLGEYIVDIIDNPQKKNMYIW